MRIATLFLIAVALPVAFPAAAQSPANFRSNALLTPRGNDPLQVLELPFEAYRDTRRDLADIRIYNGSGDSLPFAWAPDPGRLVEPAAPIDLPIFPVRKLPPAGQATTEVTVRAADGTLISIRGAKHAPAKPVPAKPVPGTGQAPGTGTGQAPGTGSGQVARKTPGPRAAAWLADASQASEPIAAVILDWEQAPGTEMLTARVEGSNDLKSWQQLGSAPLMRLAAPTGGRGLVQPSIEFAPRNVKYLRITADAPAFEPTAIRAQYAPRGKAPPRLVRTVDAIKAEGSDEITFDLGAWLPVEALRLLPAQDNAVLVGTIHARDDPAEPWRPLFTATFYRLQREGVQSMSAPHELGRRAARYWMVRMSPGSSTGPQPKLEAHWTPARLVFVREGEGPFYLAFGNPNGRPTALAIESVIPDYKRGAEEVLPRARLGEVMAGPPPNRWDKLIGELDARRVALWTVLVAGVIALGVMAHRLSREVK